MKRAAILFLVLLHAFEASWLLQGGYDVLFPTIVHEEPVEAACCSSRCGCSAQKQKKRQCCCFPESKTAAAEAPKPSSDAGSLLEEARCAGTREAIARAIAQPVLISSTPFLLVDVSLRLFALPETLPPDVLPTPPPDKVPV